MVTKICCITIIHTNNKQAEEEVRALQKKIQQVENELDQVQENLGNANSKLDEKDKALQVVSRQFSSFCHISHKRYIYACHHTNPTSRLILPQFRPLILFYAASL